jgi:carbonic anhydrase
MTARRPAHRLLHAAGLLCVLAWSPAGANDAHAADHPAEASASKPAKHAAEPAAEPAAAARPAERTPPAPVHTLEDLRDKLSQRIGSTKAVDRKSLLVMQVSKPAENDMTVSARPAPPNSRAANGRPARAGKPASHADARGDAHAAHWSYAGENGPQAWGTIKGDFSTCATGQRQSPIDIREGIAVNLEPVRFDYRESSFSVIDNGHTVQVNLAPGNAIEVLGRRYELLQFHFHRPSEERIGGRQFDMVAHLVHKDPEGKLAVVAVLLERGSVQPIVQTVWNNLPLEKGEAQPARVMLDPSALLPPDRRYYTYMGSLTTPPCSEGVLWMVLQNPVSIAPEQIDIFSKLYPMNARPVQATAGRLIKQSN